MPNDELIDVFDELGQPQGVLPRDQAHLEGRWHQVFHVLIVAMRNTTPVVILQERAHTKLTFPGLLDLSATGHLLAGETAVEGVREVAEEIGVALNPIGLVPLGVRRVVDETPEGVNREFVHIFLYRDERPLAAYEPRSIEVAAVVEIPISAALALLSGEATDFNATYFNYQGQFSTRRITRNNFVPEGPTVKSDASEWGYWRTVLIMAERYLMGERKLSI